MKSLQNMYGGGDDSVSIEEAQALIQEGFVAKAKREQLEGMREIEQQEVNLRMFSMDIATRLATSTSDSIDMRETFVLAEQIRRYVSEGKYYDSATAELQMKKVEDNGAATLGQ